MKYAATYYLPSGTYCYEPTLHDGRWFSPFETGLATWRYYRKFLLEHLTMLLRVECDTWTALCAPAGYRFSNGTVRFERPLVCC